jgi:hypothetical protein
MPEGRFLGRNGSFVMEGKSLRVTEENITDSGDEGMEVRGGRYRYRERAEGSDDGILMVFDFKSRRLI